MQKRCSVALILVNSFKQVFLRHNPRRNEIVILGNNSHRVTLYTRIHNSRHVSSEDAKAGNDDFLKVARVEPPTRGVFSHLLPIDEPFEGRGWMRLAAGAVQPKDVAGRVDLLLAGYRRPVLRQNCNHIDNVYARSLPFSLCYLSTLPAALSLSHSFSFSLCLLRLRWLFNKKLLL